LEGSRDFEVVCELARERARLRKARRLGAQKPRKKSDRVKRRLAAVGGAYKQLSPELQEHPTGMMTVRAVRERVLSILDLQDDNDVISEDTITKDIQTLGLRSRSVQRKVLPSPHSKISPADAEIERALERLDRGELQVNDPEFGIIRELAREEARSIKARRNGAQKSRKNSDEVTRRLEALIQAYRALPRKYQKYPKGSMTINKLIRKLGSQDKDHTIKKDIEQVRPLLRLIERGVIPPPGTPIVKNQAVLEKTCQKIEAGKRALVRAAMAEPPTPEPTPTPATAKLQDF
jgi:hypothetical protein